jgi:subtilisin family serine protease
VRRNGSPPAGERRYVPDEVLVQLASTTNNDAVNAFTRRMRLDQLESFTADGVTTFRWRIPDPGRRPVPTMVRALEAQGIVLAAQPNYLYRLQQQPGERPQTAAAGEGASEQYALAKLHLPQAHALAKGDRVLVAVIDSAVDADHPELAGAVAESLDTLDLPVKPDPHGTAVAGAIAAHARLTGAAPKASILAVRAFFGRPDGTVEATSYTIEKGLFLAMSHGARVINMSFTGPRDPAIEQRMARARAQGVVLVAAAGNAGPKSGPLYPAAYPGVIAVTAIDADDKLFSGANRGTHIAVAAPGVDLMLPAPDGGYQVITGTSFAAAEVSGIVALLLEERPALGQDGVRRVLTATAKHLGPKGSEREFGAGLVDAYEAVRSVRPEVATTGAELTPLRRSK